MRYNAPGEVQVGYWKTFLLRKSVQALEEGSGGVTVPGGVQHGDVALRERGLLGLDLILRGLFQPLWFCDVLLAPLLVLRLSRSLQY